MHYPHLFTNLNLPHRYTIKTLQLGCALLTIILIHKKSYEIAQFYFKEFFYEEIILEEKKNLVQLKPLLM